MIKKGQKSRDTVPLSIAYLNLYTVGTEKKVADSLPTKLQETHLQVLLNLQVVLIYSNYATYG